MSNSRSSVTTTTFKRAEPQLFVADMARSLAFFTAGLGFEVEFTYGEPTFYAQVARGEAHLNLRTVPGPLVDPSLTQREGYLAATVCVEGLEELFADYQRSGVDFQQTLRRESWGARTLIVRDPDGNLILFAE